MIKNIIFDLGGVIYDIRYQNVPEAFAKLGFSNFADYYTQAAQTGAIDFYEKGDISTAEFRQYIRSISPVSLTDAQIDDAWNAIIIDVPAHRVEFLEELKNQYNLFLFSNTNELNYNQFMEDLPKKFGYNIFEKIFKKAYFSHHIHLRKPDAEAFRFLLAEQQLNPAETLFIDDTVRHIESAKRLGIHTYLLPKGEDICEKKWTAIC